MAPLDPSAAGETTISAPKALSSLTRSTETFSGTTAVKGYPFTLAIMASPAAVLPEEDSKMRWPGCRLPSFSASSIIERAALSFTEPAGLRPSSLTSIRTRGLGLSSLTSTRGVLPIVSSTLS